MRLLHEVVAAGRGDHPDVLHGVEHGKLMKGRPITPELVSVYCLWNIVLTQEADKEGLGGLSIAVPLKDNVQHDAMFINRPPQPVGDAAYVHMHFVEVLLGTPSGFPVTETLGEHVAELDAPAAD